MPTLQDFDPQGGKEEQEVYEKKDAKRILLPPDPPFLLVKPSFGVGRSLITKDEHIYTCEFRWAVPALQDSITDA